MAYLSFAGRRDEEAVIREAHSAPPGFPDPPALFFGDNLDGMARMLSRFAGAVSLACLDPPYNTGRVFRISKTGRAGTGSEGETAYGDSMAFDSWLGFIRDRLILVRELLSREGSLYLHMGPGTVHYAKALADEVFGRGNFLNDIARIKCNPKNFARRAWGNQKDTILFYAKDKKSVLFNGIGEPMTEEEAARAFPKKDARGRRCATVPLHAPGASGGETGKPWRGMEPPEGRHWRRPPAELDAMDEAGLVEWSPSGNPRGIRYAGERPERKVQDVWDFRDPPFPSWPTQKNAALLERIIAQSSPPGGLVLDPFAGSGEALSAADRLGRLWTGMDSSPKARPMPAARFPGARVLSV